MSGWTIVASLPVILLGIAVWGFAVWLSWSHWKRRHFRSAIGLLEGLRIGIVALLVLTLLKPERVRRVERTEKPAVVILHDASASMTTMDTVVSNRAVSRKGWVENALSNRFYAPLEAGSRIEIHAFARPSFRGGLKSVAGGKLEERLGARRMGDTTTAPGNSGEAKSVAEGTDLSLALENVLRQFDDLKGVILLSDGDWNLGESPAGAAARYRDRKVPVFAVAVGQKTPLPDIAIEDVDAPSYGLLGEQISLPVWLRNDFSRGVSTKLQLLDGLESAADEGRLARPTVLMEKEVFLPPNGGLLEAIVWEPRKTGERNLRLRLVSEPGELLADNNERSFSIRIRIETIKVLVVDSKPRWEYRYLRNALERDPGVRMHCILFHPGLATGAGRHYLPSFPGSKERIVDYDVIFLGDVGAVPEQLKESDLELIRGLVEQQAGGLVFLPGRGGFQKTLLNGPLADLIPVVLDRQKPEGIALQNESRLALSTTGKRHWLTRFDAESQKNDELWRQLPGFYWSAAVEKSRPGSEVLAVHSAMRNSWGRIPLLVTRFFGNGKVLFMGTDSAWRWRRGVEDKYHYRFWSQIVRWMAHQRHLSKSEGIRLSWTPEAAEVGDSIHLHASVADPSGYPAQSGRVLAYVDSPSGRSEKIEFAPLKGGWGVFAAAFQPQETGKHQITIQAEEHGRRLETALPVTRPLLEKIGQPVNRRALREIASLSQGRLASTEELAAVVNGLQSMPEPALREIRLRLWANPWWGGFLLILLALYWGGRKLVGLV